MEEECVLVVDDDAKVLEIARVFLKSEGIEVHCASSGEEALRLVSDKPFTMIITDNNMPGMKGTELASRVRETTPDMLIFMITGDVSSETQSSAHDTGIDKIFAKPVRFLEILKSAREFVRKRNSPM